MTKSGEMGARCHQIYNFLYEYVQGHGFPPSVREIAEAVGLSSPSTVHMHLQKLEEFGYISRGPNKSRTIEFLHTSQPKPRVEEFAEDLEDDVIQFSNSAPLPLVGQVAAGSPILAEENIEEYMSLPSILTASETSFILKVQGESMINVGIFDGDYLVVAKSSTAQNGDIVVALIDDSATIKTFYKEKDYIRLQPENDALDPIIVKNPIILGKVTGLFRSM